MILVVRLAGLVLLAMGFFTMYFAHKHGRLEPWSITGSLCYLVAGLSGVLFGSWWPILAGTLVAGGINGLGGVARDRR
jgi:hypothetical protein